MQATSAASSTCSTPWVTALGQQRTEAEPGRLGVLGLTHPQARHPRAAFYHLPTFVRVRGPPLEAHALVEHLCLTERGTQCGALSQWYLGSDHLEAPVPVTAHRGKA